MAIFDYPRAKQGGPLKCPFMSIYVQLVLDNSAEINRFSPDKLIDFVEAIVGSWAPESSLLLNQPGRYKNNILNTVWFSLPMAWKMAPPYRVASKTQTFFTTREFAISTLAHSQSNQ